MSWDYELLSSFISSSKNLIPNDGLKEVLHYYAHDEPEMAYEGLLIELINCRQYPKNFNFSEWENLALHYQLSLENVFWDTNLNGEFWSRLQSWGNSYCMK